MSIENDRELYERVTVLEVWREAHDRALTMQAKEYERRLEALNHDYTRHQQALATYVSRAEWNAEAKVMAAAIQSFDRWRSWVIGFAAAMAVVGGVVGGAVVKLFSK